MRVCSCGPRCRDIEAKNLDVRVTREAVTISGEHRHQAQASDRHYFRSEFRYGKVQRTIPLPVPVQNDQVKAEFKDGILTLSLPKVPEMQDKVFKVELS